MTADELFEAYKAADAAGEDPSPHAYLQRAPEAERRLLEQLIDAYLDLAELPEPRRSLAAFKQDPVAQRAMAAAEPALRGLESWVSLLPAARHAAQVPRTGLIQRLADALGVGDRADLVGDYYHRMETGSLPAAGVSDRVLQALAEIIAVPADRLRAAGERLAPPSSGSGAVFARTASADIPLASMPAPEDEDLDSEDEVDRLFTGG